MNNPTPQQPSKPTKEGTRNIVIGQDISSVKQQLAKEFRRQMTPEEKILWQHLRANRLNNLHFRRQQIIDGFLADFYCHAAALVIEVDGKIHEQQVEYDAERDKVLSARGLRLLRIKNEEVRQELDNVLMRIVQACSQQS
ncbi:MAG: endonuclease domain-containing protein [Hassallia sp. WJT32-NPBG1]|jgi:very-short-patch-repair endonuclease|nr:endonuclease domain-containing protein [Hassallia sp. WJT32-NPBG1]